MLSNHLKDQILPMDLADSSLVAVAELYNIKEVAAIDSDYIIYRTKNKKSLKNIFLPFIK